MGALEMADNDKVPELTNGTFDEFIKDGLVFVDFFAEWCMPCVMMGPIIDEMSETFRGKIKFGKVNIEDNQSLAEKFGVRSIPNFVLFKDGKVADNFIGGMPAEELEEKLRKHLE